MGIFSSEETAYPPAGRFTQKMGAFYSKRFHEFAEVLDQVFCSPRCCPNRPDRLSKPAHVPSDHAEPCG
jgi:hypothetical protein